MGYHNENQSTNNPLAFISGVVGGIVQYFMNIHLNIDFWSKLLESAITAGVCGFVGIAGKEIFVVLKESILDYFKSPKKKKN